MLQVFEDVKDDKMNPNKAHTLIKASNAVINIQRTKILSTRICGEQMKFFKD
jgi:hypothetical protein